MFAALDLAAFQASFTDRINPVWAALGVRHIPIDGQAVRDSRGPDGPCLHQVSASAAEQRLPLARVAVPDKGNEITTFPEVLAGINAIGCRKAIAAQTGASGDDLLTVQDNQPTLVVVAARRLVRPGGGRPPMLRDRAHCPSLRAVITFRSSTFPPRLFSSTIMVSFPFSNVIRT